MKKGIILKNERKIVIYVHDLFLEIGHSNAIIETVNNLDVEIKELVVVAYSSDNLDKLFPGIKCSKIFIKVPFKNLYPLLFKMLFFYLYGFTVSFFKFDKSYTKIGIGISYLWADIVNVQFVHKHWEEFYFNFLNKNSFKYFYKKVLFFFFNIFENYVFRHPKKKFSSLSKFTTNYLLKNFPIANDKIVTTYSGINLDKFNIDQRPKSELKAELLRDYPGLESLDLNSPIYLFVGAYERKGLLKILETLSQKVEESQLIIVGKPESQSRILYPNNLKTFRIEFTKKLPLFYSLADSFVFASIYEPFGLVIIEAAAMGLELFVTQDNVGACELLENKNGIHLYKDHSDFKIENIKILSLEQRLKWREERLSYLREYTWDKTGKSFYKLLVN